MKQDEIKKLSERDKAREKLSVWFGSRDNFYHPPREAVMNSTDEIITNFESGNILVELLDDNRTFICYDEGRGIPIGEDDNVELLFLTLFAGGKYENEEGTMTGTNGCGLTATNYNSKSFKVESWYGGHYHYVEFANGGEIVVPLTKEKCEKELHATKITFVLDDEMFTSNIFDSEEIEDIVKHAAVGSNKVTLTYKYKDKETVYHYESLSDYYAENTSENTCAPAIGASKTFDDNGEQTTVELVLSTSSEPFQETFLNLTHLKEHGSIYDGIVNGIKLYANKHCRDNKLFPKGMTSFSNNDIESSVSFVASVLSNKVEFQNQTKFSTEKKLYKAISQKYVAEVLELFQIEQPKQFKKMIDHFLLVQKHNEKSSKAAKQLKKKLSEGVEGIGSTPSNLVDCKTHGEMAEIYVAEGHSALGSVILARDGVYQAAYALRGKILNCLKADYDTIFKNQIITDLVKSFGCGIQADKKNKELDSFDIKNLRYGKIIIATDADADGEQIACLIITMIYRLMPELILQGRIHIAQTPLYEVKTSKDEMVYIYNEAEKESKLKEIEGKYNIARMKGLGEMSAETMFETAMNPETRNLIQVTVKSAQKMIKSLETWMGKAVDGRKEIISNNLYKYVGNLD